MTLSRSLLSSLFVNAEQSKSISLAQWELILLIFRDSQVLAKYCYFLKSKDAFNPLPTYVKRHLENAEVIANKQQKQIEYEALELLKVTSFSSKYSIFLKGAAYSLADNEAGKGRIYSDIDLIVTKSSIKSIESNLSTLGWLAKEMDEYDQNYYREWAHEIPPMMHANRGTVLDLHHNLVPPMSGRADNLSAIIESTVTVSKNIKVLSPPAMALHSAIHLFFNEEFHNGFRDIHDLHLLFTEHNDDEFWQQILTLAKSSGFEIELFLAIRFSHQLFQTQVPTHVNQALDFYNHCWKLRYWDFLFSRVLCPHHPYLKVPYKKTAIFLALARGHLLKMPLPMLIKHSTHKMWQGLVKAIFGQAFYKTETNQRKP